MSLKPLAWSSDESFRSKRMIFGKSKATKQITALRASDAKHEYWVEKLAERDLRLTVDR